MEMEGGMRQFQRTLQEKLYQFCKCQFQAYKISHAYRVLSTLHLIWFLTTFFHLHSKTNVTELNASLLVAGRLDFWMMRQGKSNREEDKEALESPYKKINNIFMEINRKKQRKDDLCGLWEEERRYDMDDQQDNLTWPEYLDKKLGVSLRVASWWLTLVL